MRIQRKLISGASIAIGLVLLAGACSSSDDADPPSTTAAAVSGTATVATVGETVFTPVLAEVLAPPIPVPTTDGKIHLAYELVLTNAIGQDITITSIEAQADGTTLQELSGADIPTHMKVFGVSDPTAVFGPGQGGLVWMDVVVDTEADVPTALEHVITIAASAPSPPLVPATLAEHVAPVAVVDQAPVVIASPLYGDNWLDGNSCCEITPHRAAVSPLNGALDAPERFAIDYVQLDAQDRLFVGPIDELSSWPYYGAEIHAVAAGKVVAVVDDLPQQKPGANPTGLPVDEYGGNHVVQDIGNGHYAFYAHLQTGDGVKVKVGDELSTGDVVGLLGNSGNTDSPHLHFHIMDGPDPLASNGLPFVFSKFTLAATMPDDDSILALFNGQPAQLTPGVTPTEETDLMPLYRDIMDYPEP